ncbi:hypothetical protein [Agromyces mariniharenae]|uniref:Uncharacterized protein n=1 Tax=Agromyces mariniharenae TaxID=2604423 RepID=A0A5S4VFP4_9MICO|nr:hypothetical protein [Agromyces mariniharenae]TYL52865.1 hypothetical protein FYC51_03795 [Agromyces mariniharenae]
MTGEAQNEGLFPAVADIGSPTRSQSFDALGAPLSPEAALAMTSGEVESAVANVLADLDGIDSGTFFAEASRTPRGDVVLDSPQAVFVIARFNRVFGKKKLIKLSTVTETDWSTLHALVAVLVQALLARRKVAA